MFIPPLPTLKCTASVFELLWFQERIFRDASQRFRIALVSRADISRREPAFSNCSGFKSGYFATRASVFELLWFQERIFRDASQRFRIALVSRADISRREPAFSNCSGFKSGYFATRASVFKLLWFQERIFRGHPKTQTMQTADCRLQTVQTMQTVQTVQTDSFFFLFLFLHLFLTRRCFGSGHIN